MNLKSLLNFHIGPPIFFGLSTVAMLSQGSYGPAFISAIACLICTKWGWDKAMEFFKLPSEGIYKYRWWIAGGAFVIYAAALSADPTHQRKEAERKAQEKIEAARRDSIRTAEDAERRRLEAGREWQEKNLNPYKGVFAGDGRCGELCALVKRNLHDPSSFEHVSTEKRQRPDHYEVTMTYRGRNRLGALVLEQVTADVYPNGSIANVKKVE